jgi:hypothetical protein
MYVVRVLDPRERKTIPANQKKSSGAKMNDARKKEDLEVQPGFEPGLWED